MEDIEPKLNGDRLQVQTLRYHAEALFSARGPRETGGRLARNREISYFQLCGGFGKQIERIEPGVKRPFSERLRGGGCARALQR